MRQKFLLLGAVVFGLLAFVLSYQQLEAEKRRIIGDSETVVLIKLAVDKAPNEELQPGDLVRYPVRRSREMQSMSREIPWSEVSRVIGRQLETTMTAGQVLQSTDLKPMTQRQGFNGVIRPGMRAVAIPVDPVSSVNNLIQPNDDVDVISTFRFPDVRGDSSLDTVTLTILQDVKVLAVGNRWGSASLDPTGARSYGTVTLLLYPEEVEMIIFASQKGKLNLSLRNFEDVKISRETEKRSVNFKQLEKEIPTYNQRREEDRMRLK